MEHVCTNKMFCVDAIEDEITGSLVCRFSGKVFNFSQPTFVSLQVEEIKSETEEIKHIEEFLFQSVLRQFVLNPSKFPIEAYGYELYRLYLYHKLYRLFSSIEEYVISTVYMMCEGYGEVCSPNLFLFNNVLKQNELKTVKLDKGMITTGNKHWKEVINVDVTTTKNHGFVLKKLKLSNHVTINSHDKIINIYDTIKANQNKYLVDL